MTSTAKNTRIESKNSILLSALEEFFGKKMNLARIKFLGMFLTSLCKVQSVCFDKLANAFETESKKGSSLRRIQRFMSDYFLDIDSVAKFIFALLPKKPPFILAMDRTNWQFGKININALVLSIVYDGISFPILFKLLDKKGNSNTKERIEIMEKYIRLFSISTIDCLVADREFVGEMWMKYLNENSLRYYLRIKENFLITDPRKSGKIRVSWLFNSLKINDTLVLWRIYYLKGQLCYLSASKIKNKEGKPELQILVSFNEPQKAYETYKLRWQIETAFRALKSSGFNIEQTHLSDLIRIEKLFSLVIIAFTWAYVVGIYLHENVKRIRILKHGNKAQSFFKHGLDHIASILLNPFAKDEIGIVKFLSCT